MTVDAVTVVVIGAAINAVIVVVIVVTVVVVVGILIDGVIVIINIVFVLSNLVKFVEILERRFDVGDTPFAWDDQRQRFTFERIQFIRRFGRYRRNR